jgi:hypothetical protein
VVTVELEWVPEFRRTDVGRACELPAGAYANCLALSARCALWLRERGVECGLLQMTGAPKRFDGAGRWPFTDPAATRHWTIRIGDWSVDWTARQFRSRAAWPEVLHVDALAASWALVEDWACARCTELVADPRHMDLAPAGLEREHHAIARATGGLGPFPDPRHDMTPPLVTMCACTPAVAAAV